MKPLFTLLFCCLSFTLYAQVGVEIDFDFNTSSAPPQHYIFIDTANYHHNIWQIGGLHKAAFLPGISAPNAIMTDTLNAYPPNDTSVFVVKVPKFYPCFSSYAELYAFQFYYKLDIDTNAIARVEFSVDSGAHWVNTRDSLTQHFYWANSPADLTHSSTAIQTFKLYSTSWTHTPFDTLLFRFTFISGLGTSTKSGWMIDNIRFYPFCDSKVSQVENNSLVSIYPNPSQGDIHIKLNAPFSSVARLSVVDIQGREVFTAEEPPKNGHVKLSLPDGVYVLKYFTPNSYSVKRIVIQGH